MTGKIIGIDVAKDWLDIAEGDGTQTVRIDNTAEAIAAWLSREQPALVAFEPTGGCERLLRAILRAHGIVFVRVHPNDIIAFRQSRGIKAKTDALDAQLIACFAQEELTRRGVRPAICGDDVLQELSARRRQMRDNMQAERCRLALATHPQVRMSLARVIEALQTSLDVIEGLIDAQIKANPPAQELYGLLQTIHGIGPVTARTLIADVPELGVLSSKEIASLAGLAPVTRQSGRGRYRERTGHGKPSVRAVLFNAARAAVRHPSHFKTFYDHLVTHNKRPGKVALTAIMRKILITANAVARDKKPWKYKIA